MLMNEKEIKNFHKLIETNSKNTLSYKDFLKFVKKDNNNN